MTTVLLWKSKAVVLDSLLVLVLVLLPCWLEDVETSSSTCWLQSSTPLKPH